MAAEDTPCSPWWWTALALCGCAIILEPQMLSHLPTMAFCRIMPSVWPPEVSRFELEV